MRIGVRIFLVRFVFFCTTQHLYSTGKLRVKQTGPQAGHYLEYKGHPILLIGDSVTQGWMECAHNFDYTGYIDALADRGMNILMLWSFIGTDASRQVSDARIGYDCPETWPWSGSSDNASFDLINLNPDYFQRLKSLVAYAESRGVMVLITVHDGWTKGRLISILSTLR